MRAAAAYVGGGGVVVCVCGGGDVCARGRTRAGGDGAGAGEGGRARTGKQLTVSGLLGQAIKAYKWWEARPLADGHLWNRMQHHGVYFPPPYTPHGVKLRWGRA